MFFIDVIMYTSGLPTGSSRTDFSHQLKNYNKTDFTLIAIDPRGYGQSIPPKRDWPLEFLQRDAEDAMELVRVSSWP